MENICSFLLLTLVAVCNAGVTTSLKDIEDYYASLSEIKDIAKRSAANEENGNSLAVIPLISQAKTMFQLLGEQAQNYFGDLHAKAQAARKKRSAREWTSEESIAEKIEDLQESIAEFAWEEYEIIKEIAKHIIDDTLERFNKKGMK